MVEFAGWEMPLRYSGVIEEHNAVRERAGLFDISHMGEIEVRGGCALDACQRVTTNDVRRLQDGEAQYTLLCRPNGGVVDDVILYRFSARRLLFCVNAANRKAVAAWLEEHAGDAETLDRSDEYAQLALQGPRATTVLGRLTALALDRVRPFAFLEGPVAGQDAVVARTGYTGEDGWEIYCEPPKATSLWQALLEAGRGDGLVPAGLGARDTLRLEAALPLYGHELSPATTPLEAGLERFVRLDKGEFIGRTALEQQRRSGVVRRLVGLTALDPGIPRQGYPLEHEGRVVGEVTSGTKSPTLGKAIALGYVTPNLTEPGTRLGVRIRNRIVMAEVVPTPFYRRGRATGVAVVEGEKRLH